MAKKGILSFIQDQYRTVPPVVNADLTGKTVVVVGANTGLGYEAAKHLARMGAERLIMACRSQERGDDAVKRLKDDIGYTKAEVWLVDLGKFTSVAAFCTQALNNLERLDILLLNAATTPEESLEPTFTEDGYETTLQVNDLSPSLIGLLLLPRLIETGNTYKCTPRLTVVSSETHFMANITEDVFQSANSIETLASKEYCVPQIMKRRYEASKLLNIFFIRALTHHTDHHPVIVNTVNPGFCHSELRRKFTSPAVRLMEWVLARSTEEGARQLVFATVGTPEGSGYGGWESMRGVYVNLGTVNEVSDFCLGKEGREREDKLWNDLLIFLEKVDPRVTDTRLKYLYP